MMKKASAAILTSFMVIVAVIAFYPVVVASNNANIVTVKNDYLTLADEQSTFQSISMPVEYVNYTVSSVNGSLWATVDGVYPMQIPPASVGQELPMVYPTPPGVTNISVELNGQNVVYSNLTQSYPDALHYTYLGNWSMILVTIQPTSSSFLLTIHYQHPIMQANGTDMFLYDLNISPYLSNSSTASTAYFTVLFQTNCSDINVYTVPGDESIPRNDVRTPVNFTLSKENGVQTVSFNIVSDYSEPVPGDELVTFHESQTTQVPEFPLSATVLPLVVAAGFLIVLLQKRAHSLKSGK